MRKRPIRLALVAAAAVACCLPAVAGSAPTLPPGSIAWSTRDPGAGKAVAVSAGGTHVFATGTASGSSSGVNYSTHAYRASAGTTFWTHNYSGAGARTDTPTAIAARGNSAVYVTGSSDGGTSHLDYATVAYNASTGAQLWARRYNGPGNGDDVAESVAVTPDGTKVLVTGHSTGMPATGIDYATVAYNATTGATLWTARYNGPVNGEDDAYSLAVGPGSGRVFVTGRSAGATPPGSDSVYDYATVAYNTATGAGLWKTRYDGPGHGFDKAYSIAASPDATKVFVTGRSYGGNPSGTGPYDDYATIAYNASTGAPVWTARLNGPANGDDGGRFVRVTQDSATVVVTGTVDQVTAPASLDWDYGTYAYKAATGVRLWGARYGPYGSYGLQYVGSYPGGLALSADGTRAYVTGTSYGGTPPGLGGTGNDIATVSYALSNGNQVWAKRYDAGVNGDDYGNGVAVAPDGMTAFVTGESPPPTGTFSFLTLAYAR